MSTPGIVEKSPERFCYTEDTQSPPKYGVNWMIQLTRTQANQLVRYVYLWSSLAESGKEDVCVELLSEEGSSQTRARLRLQVISCLISSYEHLLQAWSPYSPSLWDASRWHQPLSLGSQPCSMAHIQWFLYDGPCLCHIAGCCISWCPCHASHARLDGAASLQPCTDPRSSSGCCLNHPMTESLLVPEGMALIKVDECYSRILCASLLFYVRTE